jgi:hypothetical protein
MRHEALQVPAWLIFDVRQNCAHGMDVILTERLELVPMPPTFL